MHSTSDIEAVTAAKAQDEDVFRRLPQLGERVLMDLLSGIERFDDHHQVHRDEGWLASVFSGWNGTADRRRKEMNGASVEIFMGLLKHVQGLQSFQVHSEQAIKHIALQLAKVARVVREADAETQELRASLDHVEQRMELVKVRLSSLELRQSASQALDAVSAHWSAGWWAQQSPLERLFLYFDCLSSSPFGDYARKGGDAALMLRTTAQDRASSFLLDELGAGRDELISMDAWLPYPKGVQPLAAPIIYLAGTSDSRNVIRRSIAQQGPIEDVRAPMHFSIARGVQRMWQESSLSKVGV